MRLAYLFLLVFCFEAKANIIVRQVDPLLKVLPGVTVPPAFSIGQAAGLNDYVSFQLVLKSDIDDSCSLQLTSSSISKTLLSSVKQYKVQYIKVTDNVQQHGADYIASPSGMYPDPLIPQNKYSLRKDEVLPVILDLYVDKRFSIGVHSIEVRVVSKSKARGATTISFQVFNVAIPKGKLGYINWYHDADYSSMNNGTPVVNFSPTYWKIFKNNVQVTKDFGQNTFVINPMFLIKFSKAENKFRYDFTNLNKAVHIILNEVKMDYVVARQFGMRMQGWESEFGWQMPSFYNEREYMMVNKPLQDPDAKSFYTDFLKAYYNNYKSNKSLPKILQHLADEPLDSNARSYTQIARTVRAIAPDLRIIEATMTARMFSDADIVVLLLSDLSKFQKEIAQFLKTPGKQVWFYTAMHPQGDWANRFIEQPAMKTLLLPWIAFKYNLNGYLHWALNFWIGDPYKDAGFAPYNLPGGDAYIVYPGNNTFNPSFRFLVFRNGLSDVAILSLLRTFSPKDARRIADDLVKDYSTYNTNTAHYFGKRKEMLTLLSSGKR
jgi:hypothetical protein